MADYDGATLDLARQLITCRSVTPDDGGCLGILEDRLTQAGFACERMDRGAVGNLWARWGRGGPVVCVAGHVDVVPAGPVDRWTSDPFTPTDRDGWLYGRGASDMKGPLAALVTAAERVAASKPASGTVAVLVTSDEEGDAVDGTAFVVETLRGRGETIDACVVGEPTSVQRLGDRIKCGRRGSLTGDLQVAGVQCHIAYPERGRNPILQTLPALAELAATQWDDGNADFPPTAFQISNIHAGTGATNVIPGGLDVNFNFRYSPETTAEHLQAGVREVLDRHGLTYELTWRPISRPFSMSDGPLLDALTAAIRDVTGVEPERSTAGGTSDGRFLATIAGEVVEFGPTSDTIHKVDERIRVADLQALSEIYERALTARLGR